MAVEKQRQSVKVRLIQGALLLIPGVWLATQTEGLALVIGVVCLAGAGYQFVTAAVAQGVRDGQSG